MLIDAGISGLKAQRRLEAAGRNIRNVDALILSHDHSDHTSGAGIFQRKFALPIHATRKTMSAAQRRNIGPVEDVRFFSAGDTIDLGSMQVHTMPTPHDGVDGVMFIIQCGHKRLGVLTDLGHPFEALGAALGSVDAAFIESNYDPGMLRNGPYPVFLQNRIAGPGGHLSNDQCASLLDKCGRGLKWACLAHLSEQNNSPEVAMRTNRQAISHGLTLHIASRYEAGGPLEI